MEELNKQPFKGICFMQEDKGRDTEIVLPIVYAAEKFLNCKIDFRLKWNAHLIYKEKPDFVIIPANCIGSKMYHDIAKYCFRQKIKIFSFISEGNFNDKIEYNYFGFNDDKFFYQEYVCSWSERTQKYMQERSPEQADKIVLTGASGFDRFKIYEFKTKEQFLRKYNKTRYKKVVTYAGWAFGKIQYEQGLDELKPFYENQKGGVKWVEEQRKKVRDALKYVIENNPDTLFILKQHPAEYYPGLNLDELNEMSELTGYENVLYIQGHTEGIHDLISVADVLLGFETTSAIETWIMEKTPTIFINPTTDFTRVDIYKGCLIAKDGTELDKYLKEYYQTGKIEEFESDKLKKEQEKIIKNSIGFKDGKNHLRHIFYLNKVLKSINKEEINYQKSSYFRSLYLFFILMKPFYKYKIVNKLPWFSKFNWVFERHQLSNIKKLRKEYAPFMEKFYQKEKIDEKGLLKFWEEEPCCS